jgi:hypothetical protein
MTTDAQTQIAADGNSPKKVHVQGMGSSEDHALADKVLAAEYASTRPGRGGVRRVRLRPPSPSGISRHNLDL